MTDSADAPPLKVPLGISPKTQPTFDSLLRRSRNRLRLLHSGQDKVEYLSDEQYLRGARLTIEEDQYVLVAPLLDPPQPDLVGYPSFGGSPGGGAVEKVAANDADGGRGSPEDAGSAQTGIRMEHGDPSMSLDAALDALLAANVIEGVGEIGLPMSPNAVSGVCFPASVDASVGAIRSGHATLGTQMQVAAKVQLVAPADAKRLVVDQAVKCIEASSSLLSQVVKISQESSNLIGDIRSLERRTNMNSGPARSFVAAREPEFQANVDGHLVPFTAPPVRGEMAGKEIVRIKFQFDFTKSENDVLRVGVLEAVGTGVPDGVCQLGGHDVRFVGLTDWQRGVLLILRGNGEILNMGVKEGVSTARLARKPALVVDAGNWLELKQQAMDILARAQLPAVPGPDAPASPDRDDEGAA